MMMMNDDVLVGIACRPIRRMKLTYLGVVATLLLDNVES